MQAGICSGLKYRKLAKEIKDRKKQRYNMCSWTRKHNIKMTMILKRSIHSRQPL